MKLSEVVKCRISPATKRALDASALKSGATASDVMRVAIAQVVVGHSLDAAVRADMLSVRLLANAVLAWADNAGYDEAHELVELGERLREVAARHLRRLS